MADIRNIHQMQVAAAKENSIGNEVSALQAALREWGFHSRIYAEEVAPNMRSEAQHFSRYRPSRHDLVIYHYSTGSALTHFLRTCQVPILLIYHNITPERYMLGLGGGARERAYRGREALSSLRDQTVLALARSEYSRVELQELGFDRSRVWPVVVSEELFQTEPDGDVLARFDLPEAVNLLFVGRIVPNKRQEDVIKAFYFYQKITPHARLFLVGSWRNTRRYAEWLHWFADRLGLGDGVRLTGHVSTAELAAYYRLADVFLCMSEHEGFCIPLIEAMRFGVPVVAFDSTAVPETMGGAGVLIRKKDYPIIAEFIHLLQGNGALRDRIVSRQRERAKTFEQSTVIAAFHGIVQQLLERLR